jgi:hypothetical protein
MIQKLVNSDSAFIKSRVNLAFIAVLLTILSLLFGFILGRNSVQVTTVTNIETPSEDDITVRKSLDGKITSVDGNVFELQNTSGQYRILTNEDTVVMRGMVEVDKEVVITVLQTGDTYLAEKIRVL